jgi:hypothetical protein
MISPAVARNERKGPAGERALSGTRRGDEARQGAHPRFLEEGWGPHPARSSPPLSRKPRGRGLNGTPGWGSCSPERRGSRRIGPPDARLLRACGARWTMGCGDPREARVINGCGGGAGQKDAHQVEAWAGCGVCGGSRVFQKGSSPIWLQTSQAMVRRRCSAVVRRHSRSRQSISSFRVGHRRRTSGWVDGAGAVRAHENFFEETPSCSFPASAGEEASRKRTRPSLHEHLMRDLANSRNARGPARSRRGRPRGKVHGIAHQVKPDGRLRGAVGGKGVSEKMRMASCRASIRLPVPTSPGKRGAPRHDRRAGHGVACGEPRRRSGGCAACNKSAMILQKPPYHTRTALRRDDGGVVGRVRGPMPRADTEHYE